MNDIIILKDSPNYKHILKKLVVVNKSINRKTKGLLYRLDTNDFSGIRWNNLTEGRHSIMLSGGPLLTEGELIPKTNIKILQIRKFYNSKLPTYIIVLEDNDLSSI